MQIQLPDELEAELQIRAHTAGFRNVEEYILQLVKAEDSRQRPLKHAALEKLRELRKSVPKMTTEEVVELIHEGRDQCR